MKKIFFILTMASVAFTGCYKDDNEKVISGTTTLTGANVVPAVTTTGTATMNYSYNYNTRAFTYQIDYSNLTDSCTQFGISNVLAGNVLPSSTYQLFNFSTTTSLQRRKAGTFTGQFVVDGQSIKLDDLRTGKYCVYLRSKAFFAAPTAELRGQIAF